MSNKKGPIWVMRMTKRKAILITMLIMGLSGCASRYHPLIMGESNLASLLPPSHFAPGWNREEDPIYYNPDNLYEYIDGAAELYLDYGFKKLATAIYFYAGKEDDFLTVDIYNMGSELNAFGIHSSYRSSKAQSLEIGSEAYLTDYTLAFYKGKYFIYLQASKPSGETRISMKKAAQIVAGRIPGQAKRPPELGYLPREKLMGNTPQYIPKGLLGYHFLPGGIQAEYQLGKEKVTLFIAFCSSLQGARETFHKYVEQLRKSGEDFAFQPDLTEDAFLADDPYYGKVLVARHKKFLLGVVNLPNFKEGKSLLRVTLKRIEAGENE